jgi:hypothetical protein
MSSVKQGTGTPRMRPVIVDVKRKAQARKESSPTGERGGEVAVGKPQRRQSNWEARGKASNEERKVEIGSRHLKLHVSHRPGRSRLGSGSVEESRATLGVGTSSPGRDFKGERSPSRTDHPREPEIANARSRYMAWYQQKRQEMEKKRREKKEAEEERTRSRWLKPRPGGRPRKAKSAEDVDQRESNIKVRKSGSP